MTPMQTPAPWSLWLPRGAALAGLLVVGAAHAAPTWAPPPAPTAPVTDVAGVLSPPVRAALDQRLTRYAAESGHQLVVYLDHSSGGVPIEEFAVKSFAAWKLGQAGRDDGVAVFAMTDDRTLRVEVGYGLEDTITDLAASAVIRTTMLPLIKAGKWDDAVVQGVESLVDTIEAKPGSLPADGADSDEDAAMGLPEKVALGVLAALFLIFLILRPRSALGMLWMVGRLGLGGASGGGFRGGGGRSGGGGATGRW